MLLAHAALPGRVVAATIDHALRAESAQEAAFVSDLCASLGIPHQTRRIEVADGNLQDRARDARYRALQEAFFELGADTLATAHHADDQAETVLMRLNRGSGVSGLAGIRAHRVDVNFDLLSEMLVVRPLLEWRKEELAQIVDEAGIEPVRDSSNEDERFDRVRMRNVLREADWLDPVAVARSARILQDAERIVDEAIRDTYRRSVFAEGEAVWFHRGDTFLIEVEIVSRILKEFGSTPRGSAVATMVEALRKDGAACLAGVMAKRAWHQKDPLTQVDAWKFEREPPRNS
ncbi:tRNA lysidine(34) synthetase TilS [Alteriqipengyuania lutimaris]|uniref:tRNA(Ile)-lysidine synthase n=2 Tax=Alteriqipengyuania lutimaris TaxID=1538146 RepID=A0A395LNW7_9SPHN|nr:tRNA lysidine(34) synthetase TilS [Alteriqipengyuania lutimaris]